MTLTDLNAMDRSGFTEAVGWVFEHSPWVAERAWDSRPFSSADDLHARMCREVEIASPEERMALVCAHPDLATRTRLSDASASEQKGAGLDQASADEFARYKQRFGFPFLYAVKGSTLDQIRAALAERRERTREEEFAEAVQQVFRIARFRLQDYLERTV